MNDNLYAFMYSRINGCPFFLFFLIHFIILLYALNFFFITDKDGFRIWVECFLWESIENYDNQGCMHNYYSYMHRWKYVTQHVLLSPTEPITRTFHE